MKRFLPTLGFSLFLLFLVANCTTQKQVPKSIKTKAIVQQTYVDEKPYIQHPKEERKTFFPETDAEKKWVDSVYNQMTFDERLGQLFIVIAYSNKDTVHTNSIERLITNEKIGGVMFLQGGAVRQARLTNKFQSKSKLPLFVAIDAEWGLSMRLDSTYRYPWNMTLGAIQDKKLIEKLGKQMATHTKRMGIQMNFSPVLDINTNPDNPIIGFRSFGESKENVADCASAIMKGFQSEGILATGKHFPGHGDTSVDSHKTLPTIDFSRERIENVELYPYKKLFDDGLESVMVAHLNVPSLEPREGIPSSVSYGVVTDLLKKELGFDGLIFTDALNMKGATNFRKPGEIDYEAFVAGNDILLCSENVAVGKDRLCNAIQDSLIPESRLEYSVKKILKYKYKLGLNKYKPINLGNLVENLNGKENDALQYELYENAITVLKNKNEILPIKDLTHKIAYVKLGDDTNSAFVSTLKKYTEVVEVSDTNIDSLKVKLKGFDEVIVGFHKSDKAWKKHDFTADELLWLDQIASQNNMILDVFTKPYSLLQIQNFENIKAVVVSYQNSDIAQTVSAELLFGAIDAKGKLPVSIRDEFKVGDGLSTQKLDRLGFAMPENVGMNSEKLIKIDQFAYKAIDGRMAPGMQILVARKGKVVYQKSFGFFTYSPIDRIDNNTLYDVASLTKMVATLPNVMQAYDTKKVTLETRLGEMLPEFKSSNKDSITFKELLSHYGRLKAWLPFYKATIDSVTKKPMDKYYRRVATDGFTKQVSENLFLRDDYHDTIMKKIIDSPLLSKKEYKYSDFTFIILKKYLEQITAKPLDQLVYDNFYKSMGMNNTMFNPLHRVDQCSIAPTEEDTYFRHEFIQGYVHDMEAAMEAGVGGHAGVFSNAMDIAKMMQLYLQKGSYGGQVYFSPETFDTFNTCHYCAEGNRRGLGFDKPQLGKDGPTCGCVSSSSFGHTGFTGTMAWADPETETIYVFLSNRTFPDSNAPNKLSKENIREDIQKVIQEAIIKR